MNRVREKENFFLPFFKMAESKENNPEASDRDIYDEMGLIDQGSVRMVYAKLTEIAMYAVKCACEEKQLVLFIHDTDETKTKMWNAMNKILAGKRIRLNYGNRNELEPEVGGYIRQCFASTLVNKTTLEKENVSQYQLVLCHSDCLTKRERINEIVDDISSGGASRIVLFGLVRERGDGKREQPIDATSAAAVIAQTAINLIKILFCLVFIAFVFVPIFNWIRGR